MSVPNHVAIILDGNGRWAKKRGMPRNYGHMQGSKNVEVICKAAYDMGIQYVTMYAFSTENWKREQSEVDALMRLLRSYLKTCIKTSQKNNMIVKVLGDLTGLDEDIQNKIIELERESASNTGLHFQIAINYGSRDEIIRGIRKLVADKEEKGFGVEQITEELLEGYLDTAGIPNPDLMIRTSGEMRLSNYLLWQMAYTEFYFTEVTWPDFTKEELEKAVSVYNNRDRRFGGVKEET